MSHCAWLLWGFKSSTFLSLPLLSLVTENTNHHGYFKKNSHRHQQWEINQSCLWHEILMQFWKCYTIFSFWLVSAWLHYNSFKWTTMNTNRFGQRRKVLLKYYCLSETLCMNVFQKNQFFLMESLGAFLEMCWEETKSHPALISMWLV